jgi:predicted lipoprotein with Yx(FWY)xxD motif
MMWVYKGKPLYTWKNDKAPGDTTGDGVNGTWHLATP